LIRRNAAKEIFEERLLSSDRKRIDLADIRDAGPPIDNERLQNARSFSLSLVPRPALIDVSFFSANVSHRDPSMCRTLATADRFPTTAGRWSVRHSKSGMQFEKLADFSAYGEVSTGANMAAC